MSTKNLKNKPKNELIEELIICRSKLTICKSRKTAVIVQTISETIRSVANNFFRYLSYIIMALCLAAIFYFIGGKVTKLSVEGLEFLSGDSLYEHCKTIAIIMLTITNFVLNHLRKNNIKRMSGTIAEHERRKDPKRSTSNLTKRGTTNPEDC